MNPTELYNFVDRLDREGYHIEICFEGKNIPELKINRYRIRKPSRLKPSFKRRAGA